MQEHRESGLSSCGPTFFHTCGAHMTKYAPVRFVELANDVSWTVVVDESEGDGTAVGEHVPR